MALPRIPDPHAVPVIGTDAHLPAVDAASLTPQALRARFASGAAWTPPIVGDGRLLPQRAPAPAAVLVALVDHADGLRVLLTRRTEHLRSHAGQVSFPGGRAEAHDAGPAATALREAQEEVGLDPQAVEVIGQMPAYTTVTSFVVTPVVALVPSRPALSPDRFEVAEVFEVPLAWLMNPAHHRRHRFAYEGGERQFLSMPWRGDDGEGVPREYFIWGATAAMLRNLYHFLAA